MRSLVVSDEGINGRDNLGLVQEATAGTCDWDTR